MIREWPRDEGNDPYLTSLKRLAKIINDSTPNTDVVIAFNEFCSPTLEEVIEETCRNNYSSIMVVPTMFIPGGVHSEIEIPEILENAREKYNSEIIYVWPFELEEIASLILSNVHRRLSE